MNIFFGKISGSFDHNQITEGYYQAPKDSSWFNGIVKGDFAYIIGGGKIQLWKAGDWKKSADGLDRMYFDILNADLNINIERFVAFKNFHINVPLIVKTSRSTAVEQKAFFPITFTEYDIFDYELFQDSENYRKIINRVSKTAVKENSLDLQFYFEGEELHLAPIAFCDEHLQGQFKGENLKLSGSGSRNKDKVIQKILFHQHNLHHFVDLKIQEVYDTFMCNYRIKDDSRKRNFWVVNGNEADKILYDIENNIFVMQQQYHNQQNTAVSGLLNKCIQIKDGDGVLLFNQNKYYAYGEFKSVDFDAPKTELLQNIRDNKAVIDADLITFSDAECYFEDTRSSNDFNGQYGQRLMINQWNGVHEDGVWVPGVGSETKMVNTTIMRLHDHRFYNKVVNILDGNNNYMKEEQLKELKNLLEFKKQIILQGPPGTGKTYTAKDLAEYIVKDELSLNEELQAQFIDTSNQIDIVQFHPSYTYEDFIRGIVSTAVAENIHYINKDKLFLDVVRKANNDHEKKPYILIIDEINRANLSAVLGELIYALEYRGERFKCMYPDSDNNYQIAVPENLYIIGTMNTADRSVGHIDYALRRRFAFYDVLPQVFNSKDFEKELFKIVSSLFVKDIKSQVSELTASSHLSLDFKDRPQDIWLGHSYFFRKTGVDFKLRIRYEIVPILQEYVKDGILNNTPEVHEIINKVLTYQGKDADTAD